MNIRDLDIRWTVETQSESLFKTMYVKDFKMNKESGAITDVLLTNTNSEAIRFLGEDRAKEVAEKTGLNARGVPIY